MGKVDIKIQNISKIEGHADLDVRVRDGRVEKVHIKFTDNKRFFTQAIEGQDIDSLPLSVARICGTCSIAHTMCCIECIEKALNIKLSNQTKLLKMLTINGLMIRDHALHIYLFSLPDVFDKDSVLDFVGDEINYLKDSFDIKRAGNKLSAVVAGKAVHAPFPKVGGFAKVPNNAELKALIPELKKARTKVFDVMEILFNKPIDYTRETNFVALTRKDFSFLEGLIKSTSGFKIRERDYFDFIEKVILPYSQAVGYEFTKDTYMVGALARINLNKSSLHPNTKRDCEKYLKKFPSNNIFNNNLAQTIEIVHCIDQSIDIILNNKFVKEKPIEPVYKDCTGVGVIEAPRGLLFYSLKLKKDGKIEEGKIITPTQQNQINMELDIKKLVENKMSALTKSQMRYEIEKLIRSYDPCISCATHFLKINWE